MQIERSLKYIFHVLSRCPKGAASSARIHIPDTLFYEHGTLQFWYRYDTDTCEIVRKDRRECSHDMIYEALGLEGKGIDASLRASAVSTMLAGGFNVNFPDVPVAVVLCGRLVIPGFVPGDPRKEPENHRLRREARQRQRAGQSSIRRHNVPLELVDDDDASSVDSDDSRGGVSQPKTVIAETFLDRAGLDMFLNGNDLKHHSLLQKYPLGRSLHATVVEAVYSPQVTFVTQRQNKRYLSDPSVSLYDRCVTNEANTPHLVEPIQLSPKAREMVEADCQTIARHVLLVESKCVSRMVAYFSFETVPPNAMFEEPGGVKPLLLWVSELHLSREVPRESVKRLLATHPERKLVQMQPETIPGILIGPGQAKKRQDYLLDRDKYLPYAAKVGSPSVKPGRGGTDRILASVHDHEYEHFCQELEQFRTPASRRRMHSIKSSSPSDAASSSVNNAEDSFRRTWASSPFAHLLDSANPTNKTPTEERVKKIITAGAVASGQRSLLLTPNPKDGSYKSPEQFHSPKRQGKGGDVSQSFLTGATATPSRNRSAAAESGGSRSPQRLKATVLSPPGSPQRVPLYKGEAASSPFHGAFGSSSGTDGASDSIPFVQCSPEIEEDADVHNNRNDRDNDDASSGGSSPRRRISSAAASHRSGSSARGAGRGGSDPIDCRPLKRRASASAELQAALAAARGQKEQQQETKQEQQQRRKKKYSRHDGQPPTIDSEFFGTLNGAKLQEKAKQLCSSPHSPGWMRCLSPDVNLYLHHQLSALDAAVEWLNHLAYTFENAAKRMEEKQKADIIAAGGCSGQNATNPFKALPECEVPVDIGAFPPPQALRHCPLTLQEILVAPPKIYLFTCWKMVLFPGPPVVERQAMAPSFHNQYVRQLQHSKRAASSGRAGGSSTRRRSLFQTSFEGSVASAVSEGAGDLFGASRRDGSATTPSPTKAGGEGASSPAHDGSNNSSTSNLVRSMGLFAASTSSSPSHPHSRKPRKSIIMQQNISDESYTIPYTVENSTIVSMLGSAAGREVQSVAMNVDSWTLQGVDEEFQKEHSHSLLETPAMSLSAHQMLSTPYISQRYPVFSPRSNNFVVPTPQTQTTVVNCKSVKDCRERVVGLRQLARVAETTKRYVLFETIGIVLRKAATFSKKMHLNAITADAQLAGASPLDGARAKKSSAFMAAAVRLFRDQPLRLTPTTKNEPSGGGGGGGGNDGGGSSNPTQQQQPVSVFTDPGRVIRRFFSEVPCALSAPATWAPELIELQLRFSSGDPDLHYGRNSVLIPADPHEVSPIARQLQAACEKFTVDLKLEIIKMLRVACMPNYVAGIPSDVSEELQLIDATSKLKRPTTRSRLTTDQQQAMFKEAMKQMNAEADEVASKRQNPGLLPINPAVEDWPPRLVLRPDVIPEGLC